MPVRDLVWAIAQVTGYPDTKLALVVMASEAGGDPEGPVWRGSTIELANRCEMTVLRTHQVLVALERRGLLVALGSDASGTAWRLASPQEPVPPAEPRPPTIPAAVRELVYARDDYRCKRCGSGGDLTLDHILPRSLGGPDDEGNLQTLCRSCNCSKGARV